MEFEIKQAGHDLTIKEFSPPYGKRDCDSTLIVGRRWTEDRTEAAARVLIEDMGHDGQQRVFAAFELTAEMCERMAVTLQLLAERWREYAAAAGIKAAD